MSATFVERCVDRVSPIVVKEVRASLRSRVFRVIFPLVVAAAVGIAILTIINLGHGDDMGRGVFGPVYGWMCVTVLAIVPLTAFLSLGSEWDENTYDLLVISDLRPRQIIVGKLLSASIGTVLYFSAFAPVLVFAFLLRGIDIGGVLVLLGWTFLASLAASALALAASSLSRLRVARVLLLAIVVGIGFLGVVFAVAFAESYVLRGFGGSSRSQFAWTSIAVVFALLCLGVTVACERIAHPDENHSTGPRLLVSITLAGFMAWLLWMSRGFGRSASSDLWMGSMVTILLAAIASVFFTTEDETMSRRVRRSVPTRRWLAVLWFPLLPGGARGLALFLVQAFVALGITGALVVLSHLSPSPFPAGAPEAGPALGFTACMIVYLGLGSFAFHRRTKSVFMRWMARVAIAAFALLTIFAPAFVGFLMGRVDMMNLRHPLNPFWLAGWTYSGSERGPWIVVAVVVAIGVLALNVPRTWRALKETLAASDENRAMALRLARESSSMNSAVSSST